MVVNKIVVNLLCVLETTRAHELGQDVEEMILTILKDLSAQPKSSKCSQKAQN